MSGVFIERPIVSKHKRWSISLEKYADNSCYLVCCFDGEPCKTILVKNVMKYEVLEEPESSMRNPELRGVVIVFYIYGQSFFSKLLRLPFCGLNFLFRDDAPYLLSCDSLLQRSLSKKVDEEFWCVDGVEVVKYDDVQPFKYD